MEKIKYIVIHCTATLEGLDYDAKAIDTWHKQRGFKKIGYHYVVRLDGTIETGRSEQERGAHVKGFNDCSIGIVYVGGLKKGAKGEVIPADTRTEAQKSALIRLIRAMKSKYTDAVVQGHRDFPNVRKACPCFNAKTEYYGIS